MDNPSFLVDARILVPLPAMSTALCTRRARSLAQLREK